MTCKDSDWFPVIAFYIIPFVISLVFLLLVSNYMDLIPANIESNLIGAFLTASSILFGFTSSSVIRFSNKIIDLKRRTSDVAKEFCDLYRLIKSDDKFSIKNLSYKTQIKTQNNSWGLNTACEFNGNPMDTIKKAYDFFVTSFRGDIDFYARLIYFAQLSPVIVIGISIITALLSYASILVETTLFYSLYCFMISIPLIVFSWLMSQKFLKQLEETLFNVRQQINGGIAGVLPNTYKFNANLFDERTYDNFKS